MNDFIAAKQHLTLPSWLMAIEEQVSLIKMLEYTVRRIKEKGIEHDSMFNSFEPDLLALRGAETYSFSGVAREAIFQAAASIPGDTHVPVLSIPGKGVGFWYFDQPLPIQTLDRDVGIRAILYRYRLMVTTPEDHAKTVIMPINPDGPLPTSLIFSVFVDGDGLFEDDRFHALHPSTTFEWKLGATLEQMLIGVRQDYDYQYSLNEMLRSGGKPPFDYRPSSESRQRTLNACAGIAEYFTAACTWMEQEIIVATPADAVPRVRRRQIEREAKISKPSVQVVALRKQHAEPHDAAPWEPGARDWQHQWVVSGHWRHQPCGPGRTQKKLIYINPFMKGPEGKPLMPERKRVFAVVR